MASLLVAAVAQSQQPSAEVRRQQFTRDLVAAAVERPKHEVTYDPGYVGIAYPGGDVPANAGVCSDEIVRIYRAVGVDLQKEVHEDIARDPSAYPLSRWQQKRPDRNIDHRRVPNLMVFFSRQGEELPMSRHAKDYLPGDLVAWDLGNGAVHIGMVVDQKALLSRRYMIVHNIGAGPQMEDVLFDWKITGHYRYYGPPQTATGTTGDYDRRRGEVTEVTDGATAENVLCTKLSYSPEKEPDRRRSGLGKSVKIQV
jgi:uncharacterized protein YijF (DUF1287 family)